MTAPSGTPAPLLLVDDDPDIRDVVSEVLELRGYSVVAVAGGRQALDWLRRGGRPCLILLDLMMPGMNGWEFREEQLRDPGLAEIPVVLLSGLGNLRQEAASLQVDDILPKPVDLQELTHAVESHC